MTDGTSREVGKEIVADKGYHSNDTMEAIAAAGCRSYISEPDRGDRRWEGKEEARDATYENRRRMKRQKGKNLMRKRGEFIERSFAHTLESGAMRRAHLRGQENIMKRYHLHTAAFNLGLVMRSIAGAGTPKGLNARAAGLCAEVAASIGAAIMQLIEFVRRSAPLRILVSQFWWSPGRNRFCQPRVEITPFSTAC